MLLDETSNYRAKMDLLSQYSFSTLFFPMINFLTHSESKNSEQSHSRASDAATSSSGNVHVDNQSKAHWRNCSMLPKTNLLPHESAVDQTAQQNVGACNAPTDDSAEAHIGASTGEQASATATICHRGA